MTPGEPSLLCYLLDEPEKMLGVRPQSLCLLSTERFIQIA